MLLGNHLLPDNDYLSAKINNCTKVEDCYQAWVILQDYLGVYNVTNETYRILYEKINDRYKRLKDD